MRTKLVVYAFLARLSPECVFVTAENNVAAAKDRPAQRVRRNLPRQAGRRRRGLPRMPDTGPYPTAGPFRISFRKS